MKHAFLCGLLLAAMPAFAQEDPGVGPWRPGMSKEQVVAFAEQGPYEEVAGATVTANAPFGSQKVKATITFGVSGVSVIKFHNFEGSDWRGAEKAAMDVYDHFKAKLGGADVKEVSDNIERDELNLILRQTLGTAETMNKGYAAKGQYMLVTFDMVPRQQPADVRLHCQWVYDGKSQTYSVFVYEELRSAPKRDVADNTQIKKL